MNECGQGERNFGLGLDPQKRCNTPQIHVRTYSQKCEGFKCRIFPKHVNPARGKWIFLPEQMLLNNTNSNYLIKQGPDKGYMGIQQKVFLMVTFNQHICSKFPTIIPPANKRHGFCKIFVRQINFPSAFNCRCCVPSARKVIICGLPTVRFFLLRQKIYISMHFRHFREFQLIPNLSSCGLRHQQSPSSASL